MRRPLTLTLLVLVVALTQAIPSEACNRRWRNRGCCQPVCCAPVVHCMAPTGCWCLYYEDENGATVRKGCYETVEKACEAAKDHNCKTCPIFERVWDPQLCCWILVRIRRDCGNLGDKWTCKIVFESECPEDLQKKK